MSEIEKLRNDYNKLINDLQNKTKIYIKFCINLLNEIKSQMKPNNFNEYNKILLDFRNIEINDELNRISTLDILFTRYLTLKKLYTRLSILKKKIILENENDNILIVTLPNNKGWRYKILEEYQEKDQEDEQEDEQEEDQE